MILLSDLASDAMLDTVGRLLDRGSIELLSDAGSVLAVLKLSDPATEQASGGELEFRKIAEADAKAAGKASTARIVASDGREIFVCDCGGRDSNCVIKLSTTAITRGSPVRIDSFRLIQG
jgi:hypothetical protein